ncbi:MULTISPECIES: 2-hydroxyacid dehydrogenase [Bacillaceae]|uniref:D-glycerate dehydrogenase n=1 Tax=Evansella alkalicola TaxID=745819 RepID=A0ABS6JWS6_9BACI|nr:MULTISPECIES: D-glycerate dehydrogenase [Bacillaceae]MBU9722129.1 D-glycerate dehydrogenase [Bacillus alkalicola]
MEKPFIYVTRKVPEEALLPLMEIGEVEMWPHEMEPIPREILIEKAKTATALYTMLSDKIDEKLLDQSPNLKVVSNMAVGFDNINIQAATEKGVVVCNTPDVLTDTTADLTFGLLMATARRIVEGAEYIKAGNWKNWAPMLLAGTDIHHKTLGIIGMGRIGAAVAKRAKGFDMEILYHNRTHNSDAEKELGATYVSFQHLLERSDFVVCLAPLTEKTKEMFDIEAFKQMKNSSIFINASRGGLVNEDDLIIALSSKEIAAAGLDVFREEPISNDHPLLGFSNVVALPHIGSASVETRQEMAKLASRNIIDVLSGKKPEATVN